jgi:hypothetical protein
VSVIALSDVVRGEVFEGLPASASRVSVRDCRKRGPRAVVGLMKRGSPRAAMSYDGAAMTATEFAEDLVRLGVLF